MPRNLSTGVYTAPAGTYAAYGTLISPTAYNAFVADIGAEMSSSIDARGETPMAAPLNMSGQQINAVAAGVASTDAANVGQLVAPGMLGWWPVSTPPTGWFVRNGQAVSRAANPGLFAVIGTNFGAGDGSTTFNVPNAIDRFSVGAGGLYAVGSTGGEATHALTVGELAAHNHGVSENSHSHSMTHGHGTNENPHTHSFGGVVNPGGVSGATGIGWSFNNGGTTGGSTTGLTVNTFTGSTASASTGLSINSNGSGTGHNNIPPYIADTPIIKGG